MMQRLGYNLPELPLPANMPGWAKELTIQTQADCDAKYLHGPGGLDNLYGQAEGWIQTETIKRANSGSPATYQPAPFPMAIPRREIVDYDENGIQVSYFAPPDPNIHLPVLPPYIESSAVPPGIKMVGPPPDQMIAQMLNAVMAKQTTQDQKLDAILKAVTK